MPDHACQLPEGVPATNRWFCPDCGAHWVFIRKLVGRQRVASWRMMSQPEETVEFRLRRQLREVAAAHRWQCDCTEDDPCRIRRALEVSDAIEVA
jgi:head-tail adaptor